MSARIAIPAILVLFAIAAPAQAQSAAQFRARGDMVALNPQPLPPEPPGSRVALNPQPLPPEPPGSLVALNPQPLPPEPPESLAALNPQPLPPVELQARFGVRANFAAPAFRTRRGF